VSGKKRPNQIGLGHELIHADHINSGDVDSHGYLPYRDAPSATVTPIGGKENPDRLARMG